MTMQKFFNSFRRYSTLTEEQLLIEGRKENVAKIYVDLAKPREELDGESVLDVLIQADPSGNQKYLEGAAKIVDQTIQHAVDQGNEIFWAKKWPVDTETRIDHHGNRVTSPVAGAQDTDNLVSPWGIAMNVAKELPKFHELQHHIPKEYRDINRINYYGELSNIVRMAQEKMQAKEREKTAKEEERIKAREESTVVDKNDYYVLIRPETEFAACYYGRGATWCIAATESENYFDHYTAQGKTFYFAFGRNLSQGNKNKMLALVVGGDNQYEEVWDAENDTLNYEETIDAIIQNMLYEKQDTGALEAYRHFTGDGYADDLTDKDKLDYVRVVKELGIRWDDALATTERGFEDEANQANAEIRAIADRWFREMQRDAEQNAYENPAVDYDQYETLLGGYDLDSHVVSVELEFPDDTGSDSVGWRSMVAVDVEIEVENHKGLEWKIDPDDTTHEEDEQIKEAVEAALKAIGIWPDSVDPSDDNPLELYVNLDSGYGSISEFEAFLEHAERLDGELQDGFVDALMAALQKTGLVDRPEREKKYWSDPAEKEKQMELPFEKGTEEVAQAERDLDYIRSPEGAALRRRVGLRENKAIKLRIRRK